MKQVIILSLAIALTLCDLAPCEPFGLRIYYGDVLLDHLSPEKAVIYFNTKEPCKASFLNVVSEEGFKKVTCAHNAIMYTSVLSPTSPSRNHSNMLPTAWQKAVQPQLLTGSHGWKLHWSILVPKIEMFVLLPWLIGEP
jgi:hypothetical protein